MWLLSYSPLLTVIMSQDSISWCLCKHGASGTSQAAALSAFATTICSSLHTPRAHPAIAQQQVCLTGSSPWDHHPGVGPSLE